MQVALPMDAIRDYCLRWRITEFAVFGSAVRGDFRAQSDLDVLVTFAADARWTLLDHVAMQDELQHIVGRKVDLVTRRGIERSRNTRRRQAILTSVEVLYAAA